MWPEKRIAWWTAEGAVAQQSLQKVVQMRVCVRARNVFLWLMKCTSPACNTSTIQYIFCYFTI